MADHEPSTQPDKSPSSSPTAPPADGSNKATKDRPCPYCGQAFTSSSLGRHLDLYIKPKNPKPPDGVHDVEEIKRVRGGITRRQPRARAKSVNGSARRKSTGLTGDSGANSARTHAGTDYDSPSASPSAGKAKGQSNYFVNNANWQATGVINDLPPRATSKSATDRGEDARREGEENRPQRHEVEPDVLKLQEAVELGRAAEMALREVLGSLEAAQKKMESKSLFPEFDFFSLSFPGLCLVILPAPGTLFTPTPFPTPESWSITPPGLRQFEALNRYTNERCTARRTQDPIPDSVMFRHHSHLSGAWEHWQSLTDNERASAWTVEILRCLVRTQEDKRQITADHEESQQRIRHLEAEYDRLSRCQLPRDFLVQPLNTIPLPQAVVKEISHTQFQSGVQEVDFNAETLIRKWRTSIRAATQPPRTALTPADIADADAHEEREKHIGSDYIMNGAVWGVGGPMPRLGQRDPGPPRPDKPAVSYQTPPQPGIVVSGEDDAGTDLDADADGEAEDDGSSSYVDHSGAPVRRQAQHLYHSQQQQPPPPPHHHPHQPHPHTTTSDSLSPAAARMPNSHNGELKRPYSAFAHSGSAANPPSASFKARRLDTNLAAPGGARPRQG